MQATSDYVRNTTRIFLIPFIFFIIIGCWIVFWVISAVWVFSVGTVEKAADVPVPVIHWDIQTRYIWIYHLFGLFWISSFIIGVA